MLRIPILCTAWIVVLALSACAGRGISSRTSDPDGSQPARPLKLVKPQYPESARTAGVEGMIVLEIVVNADGSVGNVKVVDTDLARREGTNRRSSEAWHAAVRALEAAALEAAARFEFEPAVSNGRPVRSTLTLPIRYETQTPPEDEC